jgi:hypothetical protein
MIHARAQASARAAADHAPHEHALDGGRPRPLARAHAHARLVKVGGAPAPAAALCMWPASSHGPLPLPGCARQDMRRPPAPRALTAVADDDDEPPPPPPSDCPPPDEPVAVMELPYMKLPKGLQDHLRADANELLRTLKEFMFTITQQVRARGARRRCIGRAHRAWPQS